MNTTPSEPGREEPSRICPLPFDGDDVRLVAGARAGNLSACTALYDRYSDHVRRVLTRVLGPDQDLPDLLNEVFFEALKSLHQLKDPDRLKAWITRIAVFTARKCIRQRTRRRWLTLVPGNELPEDSSRFTGEVEPDTELSEDVRALIGRMPPDEQVIFSLRFLEGMELSEIAQVGGYSLRTAKRRLASAESRFKALARTVPSVAARLGHSDKWRKR